MKTNNAILKYTILIFALIITSSCKDAKSENKGDSKTEKQENNSIEQTSDITYQCPMNCEKGKVYFDKGSCPVCKMDLAVLNHKTDCNCSKKGACKCDDGKCSCQKCAKHVSSTCEKHQNGECSCDKEACTCKDCAKHASTSECTAHKTGKCECKKGECACEDKCPAKA